MARGKGLQGFRIWASGFKGWSLAKNLMGFSGFWTLGFGLMVLGNGDLEFHHVARVNHSLGGHQTECHASQALDGRNTPATTSCCLTGNDEMDPYKSPLMSYIHSPNNHFSFHALRSIGQVSDRRVQPIVGELGITWCSAFKAL